MPLTAIVMLWVPRARSRDREKEKKCNENKKNRKNWKNIHTTLDTQWNNISRLQIVIDLGTNAVLDPISRGTQNSLLPMCNASCHVLSNIR